jgi:hypothetical protein
MSRTVLLGLLGYSREGLFGVGGSMHAILSDSARFCGWYAAC